MPEELINCLVKRKVPLKLVLNSISGTTEDDLNVFRTIGCIVGLELNDATLNLGRIQQNVYVKQLSLSNTVKFSSVVELYKFLTNFPNLEEFTSVDCLCESKNTPTPDFEPRATLLTNLNLQNSSIQFDSLRFLQMMAPRLQMFKIFKVFHAKATGLNSILQSDLVIPLIAGIFSDTIKAVNAMEIK